MKELMKKLMEAGRKDAFNSLDELIAAATELGYTEEQMNDLLDEFDGFPLDDDDLEEITGGGPVFHRSMYNRKSATHSSGCQCDACVERRSLRTWEDIQRERQQGTQKKVKIETGTMF